MRVGRRWPMNEASDRRSFHFRNPLSHRPAPKCLMITITKVTPPGQDPVGDNQPLWRYMKLSTFFQLLEGVIFIPSLEQLQKGDAKENWLPEKSPASVYRALSRHPEFKAARPFLLSAMTQLEQSRFGNGKSLPDQEVLAAVWLRELARRRCLWCWHRATSESMALWKIYGEQGIAIKSSLDRIRAALRFEGNLNVLAGPVDYRQPNFQTRAFTQNGFLFRPFLFKNAAYKYEREVRFVLKVAAQESSRFLVSVDPHKLIDAIMVSPYIPSSEGYFLTGVIKQKLGIAQVSHSTALLMDRFRSSFTDSIDYGIAKLPRTTETEAALPQVLDEL
jgi:hypothetical protein